MNNNASIGLALSGGGHKGLAHAGVLQFLEEQNIQIDVISGTSAGAIVGGLYAVGKKPAEILDFFKSVKLFSWNHLSFSKAGLLDAEKFIDYLDVIFGETKLVDLPKEMYISATDTSTPDGSKHSTDTPKPRKPLPLRVPSPAYSRPCRLKAGYTVMAVF